MKSQNQATKVELNKQNQRSAGPAVVAEPAGNLAALFELPPSPIAAAGNGSIEAQANWLGKGRLQGAQRRALAAQIGRVQGNQHLQRVVASLKRDGKTASSAPTPRQVPANQGEASESSRALVGGQPLASQYVLNAPSIHKHPDEEEEATRGKTGHTTALSYTEEWPIEHKTKGLEVGPLILGETISGKISASGTFEVAHQEGLGATMTINRKKAAAELEKKLTEQAKWKGGGEINKEGGKLGTGLELELFKGGGGTFSLTTDATIFERKGKDITFFALEVGLSYNQPVRIPLTERVTFKGSIGITVTVSVSPNWKMIGRSSLRFAGSAARFAARFGPAAAPYIIVGAAYIAWLGYGLYQITEAQRAGIRWGLETCFARGYANALKWCIIEGSLGTTDTLNKNQDFLRVDVIKRFEEVAEKAFEERKKKGSAYTKAVKEAQSVAEECGKAAALQYVNELISNHGPELWANWCKGRDPDQYTHMLKVQARTHETIGVKIFLGEAPHSWSGVLGRMLREAWAGSR